MRRNLSIAAAAFAALTVIACGTGSPDEDRATAPDTAVDTTAPAKTAPKAKAPKSWGDGDWEVGKEIKPGQYETTADEGMFGCSWSRVKAFDGNSLIAFDVVPDGGKGRMVVKKSDYGVSFSGGCKWTAVK